ncbi:MAG: hypothetical protein ACR2KV_14790 [Solirubrobacteraceae bacterium]
MADRAGVAAARDHYAAVVVDLRLYRLAFVPFALVLVYVAFSLAPRPRPFSSTLAPDAFDGAGAMMTLGSLAAAYPSRAPGSAGDERLARRIARDFENAGFATRIHSFIGDTVAGRRPLLTVIGRRQGRTGGSIVIVAHRDSRRPGSLAELSGSAALLELVRLFGNRVTQRTLTLVSTSGGSGGAAGAADLVGQLRDPVDAVLVLGDLAGSGARRPYVVPWSDGSQIAPIRLRRTVEAALQTQFGRSPGGTAPTDQLARLAFPLTVGEQGPLGAAGLPAVLIQASGEIGPGPTDPPSLERLQEFGRGVLRAINALDTAPDVGAPTRDVLLGSRVLPAWGIRLLAAMLALPILVAGVDMLARVRRRRQPVAPWFAWLAVGAMPFALAALFAVVLGRTGLLSAAPTGPVTSRQLPPGTAGAIALVSVAIVFGLGWVLRPTLTRRLRLRLSTPSAADWDGSAAALVLALSGVVLLTWWANPFAALLGILPLHLWLLATALDPPPPRSLGVALVAISVLPVVAVVLLYCARLGLGPAAFAWTGLLLVAGGHVGPVSLLLWSIAGGGAVAAVMIVLGRAGAGDAVQPQITVRGPVSYAGPGSLGGTDSALRR